MTKRKPALGKYKNPSFTYNYILETQRDLTEEKKNHINAICNMFYN